MSFMPSFMNSVYNNQLKNIKEKTELNPAALEFIPENIAKDDFKPYNVINLSKTNLSKTNLTNNKYIDEKIDETFDSLEKDFIKNNDWIFYM